MTETTHPDSRPRKIALALTAAAVALAGLQPLLFSLLGPGAQPWNLSVIGAVGVFAAARLGFWPAVVSTALAVVFKDTAFYFIRGWHPSLWSYPLFMGYAVIGRLMLRRSQSPATIGLSALSGSLCFFVASNFLCWLEPGLGYERSLSGLTTCYIAAIPFFQGTLAGDLLFTGTLFAAYAVWSRAGAPASEPVAVPVEYGATPPLSPQSRLPRR